MSPTHKLSLNELKEFTSYIPLRLTPTERSLLTVLESTLHVSEYTDNVDVSSNRYGYGTARGGGGGGGKVKKILDGILEACHVATGLSVCGGLDRPSVLDQCSGGGTGNDGVRRHSAAAVESPNMEQENSHMISKKDKQAMKARKKMEKKLRKQQQQQRQQEQPSALGYQATSPTTKDVPSSTVEHVPMDSITLHSSPEQPPPSSTPSPPPVVESSPNTTTLAQRSPRNNEAFFQTVFEIGRRNKVLNPSKMRATYGKLMHLLQDAQSPTIAKSLGFSLYKDMVMVRPYLEQRNALEVLEDERLILATMFVATKDDVTGEPIERYVVEAQVAQKRQYVEELLEDYAKDPMVGTSEEEKDNGLPSSSGITREELLLCIDSISDAIAVVESNVAPVKRMIHLLEENYSQSRPVNKKFSLELRGNSYSPITRYGGYGFGAFGSSYGEYRESSGPTLSHSHSTQYTFVWQSLNLWKEVQTNMHKLWVCADDDLLSTTSSYQLLNTGQGLNRVQQCPRVGSVMRGLLSKTQQAAGSPWVGLSVIHLGDRDVPNALVFIDKYTQIPRFLSPIVDFIDGIDELCMDSRTAEYIKDQFGSEADLKMTVLTDYFKHGFDGSGDDGGSCIDGRLTSSWNWTSRIAKKDYYHSFMLSGFQGFDGDFK